MKVINDPGGTPGLKSEKKLKSKKSDKCGHCNKFDGINNSV